MFASIATSSASEEQSVSKASKPTDSGDAEIEEFSEVTTTALSSQQKKTLEDSLKTAATLAKKSAKESERKKKKLLGDPAHRLRRVS